MSSTAVLLLKFVGNLEKQVNFTILEHSDQGLEHTLCVNEQVANQVTTYFPTNRHIYMKRYNANCYSRNRPIPLEIIILQKYKLKLLRHDYNERQRGNDQILEGITLRFLILSL